MVVAAAAVAADAGGEGGRVNQLEAENQVDVRGRLGCSRVVIAAGKCCLPTSLHGSPECRVVGAN